MSWIKSHKLPLALALIIGYLLFKENLSLIRYSPAPSYYFAQSSNIGLLKPASNVVSATDEYAQSPSGGTSNRLTIKESNLSLLVGDVRGAGEKIVSYAKRVGGYMVYSAYTRPSESPFASMTVRIPTSKLDSSLSFFKSLSQKVTSENLTGTDVTEEYTDIQARLDTLRKTQRKFEDILEKATNVQDILNVQQNLINLQTQIDALKGQKLALEKNAELTRITIYLSSDELSLPYAPDTVFRPAVVFKHAVRSLLTTLRIGGELLIWVVVYSPFIALALAFYFFVFKKFLKNKINI